MFSTTIYRRCLVSKGDPTIKCTDKMKHALDLQGSLVWYYPQGYTNGYLFYAHQWHWTLVSSSTSSQAYHYATREYARGESLQVLSILRSKHFTILLVWWKTFISVWWECSKPNKCLASEISLRVNFIQHPCTLLLCYWSQFNIYWYKISIHFIMFLTCYAVISW